MSALRLTDLAEQAGLECGELRRHLVAEVNRAVRAQVRAVSERDRLLFESDPGFVGRGPVSLAAQRRRR